MFTKETKKECVEKYKLHEHDKGSPEVQISLFTAKINHLNNHFKTHKKDFCSKRGLFQCIGKRSALLKYLKRKDLNRYKTLIKSLGLRK